MKLERLGDLMEVTKQQLYYHEQITSNDKYTHGQQNSYKYYLKPQTKVNMAQSEQSQTNNVPTTTIKHIQLISQVCLDSY